MDSFAAKIIRWQEKHGRHHLPWQHTRDPYAIWLSEIMLQQTQVNTVIPYYQRFLQSFPDIRHLALASLDDVLARWSGLGYYSRGRNLHRAARLIVSDHQGKFPESAEMICKLPGIGRSTSAAIAVFAYGERCAILDGNVKRVLARCFGMEGYRLLRDEDHPLAGKARSAPPSVAAHARPVCDLAVGNHVAADPGQHSDPLLPTVSAKLSRYSAPCPGVSRRCFGTLERLGLLLAGKKLAPGGAPDRQRSSGEISGKR